MRLIDADDAIRAINDLPNCPNGYSDTYDKACIIGVLEEVPTIEPKHGKWTPHPTEADWDVCTACGCGTMRRTHGYHNGAFWDAEESYTYCPWCGARMDGE